MLWKFSKSYDIFTRFLIFAYIEAKKNTSQGWYVLPLSILQFVLTRLLSIHCKSNPEGRYPKTREWQLWFHLKTLLFSRCYKCRWFFSTHRFDLQLFLPMFLSTSPFFTETPAKTHNMHQPPGSPHHLFFSVWLRFNFALCHTSLMDFHFRFYAFFHICIFTN